MKPVRSNKNFNTAASSSTTGHGLMTLPWDDNGTIDIPVSHILDIMYHGKYGKKTYIARVNMKSTSDFRYYTDHSGFNDITVVIKDMYRRALRGEDADYRDYNKSGTLKAGYMNLPHRQMAQEVEILSPEDMRPRGGDF